MPHQKADEPNSLRHGDDVHGASALDIALVVNMPDAALEATERQFRSLLGAAAVDRPVHLHVYALPDVPRSEESRRHISQSYSDISELWHRDFDGLIVTGTEPQKPELSDEPYWGSLTRLVDRADCHAYSTVWSCLAAHAAVLHLDGIRRVRLADKRFGVFECAHVSSHPLTAGYASALRMPHSRWNDLPEDALTAAGYGILTRSETAGVDAFVRERRSLFVFYQGHPEYEPLSLLLEFRRDIRRYLRGEREAFPSTPHGYFDHEALESIAQFRGRALAERRESLIEEFPTAEFAGKLTSGWTSAAVHLYRNWLEYISARKGQAIATA
jgi:homoserine O-succinyltransferase